jgi:ribosome-binding protein aMBF1 (putative translation factor)
MSQQQLADAVGTSRSAVNAWEAGRAEPRNMTALEDVLGVSLAEPEQTPDAPPRESLRARMLRVEEMIREMRAQIEEEEDPHEQAPLRQRREA